MMTTTYDPTPDERRDFETHGVVPIRQLVDQHWLDRLAGAIEDDMQEPGPFFHGYETEGEGRFHGNLRLWQHHETFREFCCNSHLPTLAQKFLGSSKINLLYDQLFVKEANMIQRTRWHNDQPYWPIKGWQVASVWVALDRTTPETGALEFIRGSHRWNRWFQPETFGKTDALSQYERNPEYEDIPDIESDRDSYDIVSWDLEPGDVYFFHAMTVHGAGGNLRKDQRRRGYTVRYTGDDVIYDGRIGTTPTLRNSELVDGAPLDSEQYPLLIS